ncbi:MAG: sensor histidine kinase [Thermoplasmatota archaeon]
MASDRTGASHAQKAHASAAAGHAASKKPTIPATAAPAFTDSRGGNPLGADELNRIMIESTKDFAIFALDPHGHVITWNPGAERLKGYTKSEIIGQHFSIFFPPEDVRAGKPQRELEAAAKEGRTEDEGWRVRKDGTRFWAVVVITALRDEHGALVAFGKVTRDETARHKAELALHQEQERSRLLVQHIVDYAIYALDPLGHVTSWNEGAERLHGYTPMEIMGQHFMTFFPPTDRASGSPQAELHAAATTGRFVGEGWRLRKDGTLFYASVVITALQDGRGALLGFSTVTRDLTTQKRQDEALHRTNRELESFNYMVAHDLRAPIRAVRHLSQVAAEDYGETLPADLRDLLRAIGESTDRMANLVEALIRFGRVGAEPLSRSAVDLAAIARAAWADAAKGLPSDDVPTLVAPSSLPVEADARLIRIVLDNLLSNAIKFTRGTKAPVVELGSKEGDGETIFFVRDNGAGFDPAKADRLFTPFNRLHDATQFEGTGIGLATVRRIVERHGGRAWAESAGHGQGATIAFTLRDRRFDRSPVAPP